MSPLTHPKAGVLLFYCNSSIRNYTLFCRMGYYYVGYVANTTPAQFLPGGTISRIEYIWVDLNGGLPFARIQPYKRLWILIYYCVVAVIRCYS